jgi:hypothetical protein
LNWSTLLIDPTGSNTSEDLRHLRSPHIAVEEDENIVLSLIKDYWYLELQPKIIKHKKNNWTCKPKNER